jgi:hypothetical protein
MYCGDIDNKYISLFLETRLASINFSSFNSNYQLFTKIGTSGTIARHP